MQWFKKKPPPVLMAWVVAIGLSVMIIGLGAYGLAALLV